VVINRIIGLYVILRLRLIIIYRRIKDRVLPRVSIAITGTN
jgi:hypothetical protein